MCFGVLRHLIDAWGMFCIPQLYCSWTNKSVVVLWVSVSEPIYQFSCTTGANFLYNDFYRRCHMHIFVRPPRFANCIPPLSLGFTSLLQQMCFVHAPNRKVSHFHTAKHMLALSCSNPPSSFTFQPHAFSWVLYMYIHHISNVCRATYLLHNYSCTVWPHALSVGSLLLAKNPIQLDCILCRSVLSSTQLQKVQWQDLWSICTRTFYPHAFSLH